MPEQYQSADSCALRLPFVQQLSHRPADAALARMSAILATHAPAPRTANALSPRAFKAAAAILQQHATVPGGMRQSLLREIA
jgi:hypothetical protein